jgi:hypothetical protein
MTGISGLQSIILGPGSSKKKQSQQTLQSLVDTKSSNNFLLKP